MIESVSTAAFALAIVIGVFTALICVIHDTGKDAFRRGWLARGDYEQQKRMEDRNG